MTPKIMQRIDIVNHQIGESYSKKLGSSPRCGGCMEDVWRMCGGWMEYVWSMEDVWRMYGGCVEYVWSMYGV
jgi:hypothetical protein